MDAGQQKIGRCPHVTTRFAHRQSEAIRNDDSSRHECRSFLDEKLGGLGRLQFILQATAVCFGGRSVWALAVMAWALAAVCISISARRFVISCDAQRSCQLVRPGFSLVGGSCSVQVAVSSLGSAAGSSDLGSSDLGSVGCGSAGFGSAVDGVSVDGASVDFGSVSALASFVLLAA